MTGARWLVIVVAVAWAAPLAWAIDWEERIERDQAARIPLWVDRFLWVGPPTLEYQSAQGERTLLSDLELSGHFRVVGPLAADLAGDGPVARSKSDILATVEGRLEEVAGALQFTGGLSAFPSGKRIAEWSAPVPAGQVRQVMHAFADEVVFHLTGERGIAQTQLACVCGERRRREVHVFDYDGRNPRAVTAGDGTALSPAWSPVEPLIAFTSFRRGEADLYAVHADSGQIFGVSHHPGLDSAPAWSPDGRRLAATLSMGEGNPDIYLLARDGKVQKRLTFHPGIDASPSFAPSGRRLVFMSDRDGTPQLFTMDTDGLDVRRIPLSENYADSPSWSPRGDLIAYAGMVNGHFDIFVAAPDGAGALRLTEGSGSNENPRFAPDGRHIVFSSNRSGGWRVYIMQVDGTAQTAVSPDDVECFYPTWSPYPERRE